MDTFEPGIARPRALWETIVEALRRAIILGELAPDLHLEEPALAQKFGVSRIPIREALVRLEHEGLIRVEPRRGAFVAGMSEDDVADLYQFRLLIEGQAVRRAVETIDRAALARLDDLVRVMDRAIRAGRPADMAAADVEFHREIVLAARSRQLLAAWDRIAGIIATILGITDAVHRDLPGAVEGHHRLVRALRDGDGEAAEMDLRGHLSTGEGVLRRAMVGTRTGVTAV
jgi:DNA-binding GntR family transcriptional regulator